MFKRIISVILSLALIFTTPSVQAYSNTVRPLSDTDGYPSSDWEDLSGLFGGEAIEIDRDTTITEDSNYDGVVNISDGKKLIFESGYTAINEGAVINGDIEIRGNASVNIYGTVNGCVTLASSSSPGYRTGWDGVYERQSNLILGSVGVCDSIVISSTEGFAGIGGMVGSLTVTENAVCDFSVWKTATVDTISYAGNDDLWVFGRAGEIHVKSGHLYLEDTNVSRVYVEDGGNFQLYGSSRVSELYVYGGYAYIHNEGRIDNLFSIYAPIYNYGEIGTAYVFDSHPFVSCDNQEHSYSSPYIIENLIIENSSSTLSREAESSISDGLKYGAVTFSGGDISLANTVVESVYAHGSADGVALENVMINSAFLDLDVMQDLDGLNIVTPDKVFILNAQVSKSFFDNYYGFLTTVYGNKFGDVDVKEVIDRFITVKDIENKGVSAPGSLSLSAGDYVSVSVESGYVPAMVLVRTPDGSMKFATMGSGSFAADESGNYSVEVYGGYYGCSVTTEKSQALTTRINAYTGEYYWDDNGAYISKSKASLSPFAFSLFDVTDNRAINYFTIDRNGLLTLPSEYSGHVISLTAVHDSINWGNYWGYAPCEVSFAAGSGQVEFTALPYGEFSGYVNGTENYSVYIYDSNGKYFGKAAVQDSHFFTTERLPKDNYQLVVIDDPAGFYCFRRLSDFIRNGLISGRDFVQLEFAGEYGVHQDYMLDGLPQAPMIQSAYVDYENTMFKSHAQSAVQGSMVEFTLLYAFTGDEPINDAYAEISLPDGCEALGDIGSEDGVLTLPLDPAENAVSFTVVSDVENAEVMLNASLRFRAGDSEEYAYIGASGCSVVNLSMYAPTATGKTTVTLSGFATPGQTVTIYDGDYAVTETVSSENGFWACDAPLSSAYGKYHDVTAVLYDGTAKEMRSDTKTVYSSTIVPVVKEFGFSYYVHGHSASVTLSEDEWCKTQWSYEYWPGSIFTFAVQLTNSDNIEKMWISSNSDGRYYTIDGYYDPQSDRWIASGQFCEDENYMPGAFSVCWELKEDEVTSLINRTEELEKEYKEIVFLDIVTEEDIANTELPEEMTCEFLNPVNTEDGFESGIAVDMFGDGLAILEGDINMTLTTGEKTLNDYIKEGYTYYPENGVLLRSTYVENEDIYVFDLIQSNDDMSDPQIPLGLPGTNEPQLRSAEKPLGDAGDRIIFGMFSAQMSFAGDALEALSESMAQNYLENGVLDQKKIDRLFKGKEVAKNFFEKLFLIKDCYDIFAEVKDTYDRINQLKQDVEEVRRRMSSMSCQCDHKTVSCRCRECGPKIEAAKTQIEDALDTLDDLAGKARANSLKLAGARVASMLTSFAVSVGTAALTAAVFGSVTVATGGVGAVLGVALCKTMLDFTVDLVQDTLFDTLLFQPLIKETDELLFEYARKSQDLFRLVGGATTCACACETTTTTTTSTSGSSGSGSSSGSGEGGGEGEGGGQSGSEGNDSPGAKPDPSGYVFEAVDSNRVSGLTATVYYQDSDRSEVLWDAESHDQVNPQITDEEGRYGWMVPFGFWKVKITGEGYETAETQWLQVPPPRVDVNIPVTSLAPAKVLRVNICEDFAEVEFDKYMDVASMDGVIVIDGKAYDAVPVNDEPSALGDGRVFATVFRAVFDTKAVNSQSYSVKIGSAQCYANVAGEEYSGTAVCAPVATALSASVAGGYAASGSETTVRVKLEAVGGFDGIEAPQVTFDNPEMAEVVSVGSVDASGNVDITVRTRMAGVVNMDVSVPGSAVRERISLPVVREQDAQLRKAISSEPAAKSGGVSAIVVIIIVLAAVLFICIAANVTIVIVSSRKKKSAEQA